MTIIIDAIVWCQLYVMDFFGTMSITIMSICDGQCWGHIILFAMSTIETLFWIKRSIPEHDRDAHFVAFAASGWDTHRSLSCDICYSPSCYHVLQSHFRRLRPWSEDALNQNDYRVFPKPKPSLLFFMSTFGYRTGSKQQKL